MRSALVVCLFLALVAGAQAADIAYLVVGTVPLNNVTSASPFVVDGATFQFTFSLPTDPTSLPGFNPSPLLGGNPIPGSPFEISGVPITSYIPDMSTGVELTGTLTGDFFFFSEGASGMFEVILSDGTNQADLSLAGPAMFTGTNNAPVMQTGIFIANNDTGLNWIQDGYPGSNAWFITDATVTTNPEPGTWLFMVGAALLLAPGLIKLRKRA